jgi:hypothetical protein
MNSVLGDRQNWSKSLKFLGLDRQFLQGSLGRTKHFNTDLAALAAPRPENISLFFNDLRSWHGTC